MLGALGGFFLPKAFGWLGRETGFPQAAFLALLALTVASLAWLHLAVRALAARRAAGVSPPVVLDTHPQLQET
jgi:NNP family nitrate/nitrite transporter-like MFS transporter